MTLALLCSGQGRQDRSMFDPVVGEPAAVPVLEATARLLGQAPDTFLASATDEALHANRESQIVCVAHALAIAWCLKLPAQLLLAGYSVGEMAAWGLAGFWDAAHTLDLTARRAELMNAQSGPNDGLGFIRGLDRGVVDSLVAQFDCAIAIINPGSLFVIGGDCAQVERCCHVAVEQGAAAARPIAVHVASHTPRLSEAVSPFLDLLKGVPLARGTGGRTLIGASDASIVWGAGGLAGLAGQIASPVDWTTTLDALVERGADQLLELGPGSALADMARTAYPSLRVRSVSDFKTLAGVDAWIARGGEDRSH